MRRVGDVGGEIVEPDIARPAGVVADREVAIAVIAVHREGLDRDAERQPGEIRAFYL